MKASPFEYARVRSVDEACSALAADEEARVIAGGQSLLPLMNLRLVRPSLLVDVNDLPGADSVRVADGAVSLGALCRHRVLVGDPVVKERAPLLSRAARFVGHPQIRNRGTLGGSVAHADPAAELPAALVALGASITLAGQAAERAVPAGEFFTGFFTTAIGPGELVTNVTVPSSSKGDGYSFTEFAPRHGDFAVVGVGAWVRSDDGVCTDARAAACGAGTVPVDLSGSLSVLRGARTLDASLLRQIATSAASSVEPLEDVHATADDRRDLLKVLLVETVRQAWAEALKEVS